MALVDTAGRLDDQPVRLQLAALRESSQMFSKGDPANGWKKLAELKVVTILAPDLIGVLVRIPGQARSETTRRWLQRAGSAIRRYQQTLLEAIAKLTALWELGHKDLKAQHVRDVVRRWEEDCLRANDVLAMISNTSPRATEVQPERLATFDDAVKQARKEQQGADQRSKSSVELSYYKDSIDAALERLCETTAAQDVISQTGRLLHETTGGMITLKDVDAARDEAARKFLVGLPDPLPKPGALLAEFSRTLWLTTRERRRGAGFPGTFPVADRRPIQWLRAAIVAELSCFAGAHEIDAIADKVLEGCPDKQTPPFRTDNVAALIEQCRRDATAQARLHARRRWLGTGDDCYVPPDLTTRSQDAPATLPISEQDDYSPAGKPLDIKELIRPKCSFVITGPSGSGKTLLLRQLQQLTLAQDGWFAVHVRAQALCEAGDLDHLTGTIQAAAAIHPGMPHDVIETVYRHLANRGRLVILIDELDEIGHWLRRRNFLEWLGQPEMQLHFFIAARPDDIAQLRFPGGWHVLQLEPFGEAQARALLGPRHELAMRMTQHDPSLMRIPLNLRILRDLIDRGVTDEVRSRWDLLKVLVDLHIYQRPRSPANVDTGELTAAAKLARFAYEVVMRETPCWERVPYGVWSSHIDEQAIDAGVRSGLIALDQPPSGGLGPDVVFNHRSCQEYLVASWMREERRWASDAFSAYWRRDLREVFRLLASQLGDALIDAVYPDSTSDNVLHMRLFTAARLASRTPQPSTCRRRLARDLKGLLGLSVHKPMAVAGLIALGTAEAAGFATESLKRAIERRQDAQDVWIAAFESGRLDGRVLIPWLTDQHERKRSRLAQRLLAALHAHLDQQQQLSVLRGLCAHAVAKPRIDLLASAEADGTVYRAQICFDDLSDAIASLPVSGAAEGTDVLRDAVCAPNNPLRWIVLTALGKLRVTDDTWIVNALIDALRSPHRVEVWAALDALSARRAEIPSDTADRMCEALLEGEGGFTVPCEYIRDGMLHNVTDRCRNEIMAALESPEQSRRHCAIQLIGLLGSALRDAELAVLRRCVQDHSVADLALSVLVRAERAACDKYVEQCVDFLRSDSYKLQEAALRAMPIIGPHLQDRHVDAILKQLVPRNASDAWTGRAYSRSAEKNAIGLCALGHVANRLDRKQMWHVLRCLEPLDELERRAAGLRWIGQWVNDKQQANLIRRARKSLDPLSLLALIAIVNPSHEDERVRRMLIRLSTHPRSEVRQSAYSALVIAHYEGVYV